MAGRKIRVEGKGVPAFVIFLSGLGTAGEAVAWPRSGPPRAETRDGTVFDVPVEVVEEVGCASECVSTVGWLCVVVAFAS